MALTGKPRSGKTTLVINIAEHLQRKGVNVAGFFTREITRNGNRTGFEVVDVSETNNKGVFADIKTRTSQRLGKYGLDLELFEKIGVAAVHKGIQQRLPIIIDEVGPMELKSQSFRDLLGKLLSMKSLDGGNDVNAFSSVLIFTVHCKACDPLVQQVKSDSVLYEITPQNRHKLFGSISSEVLKNIGY